MGLAHHRLPVHLPHAATVADRIVSVLTQTARRKEPAHAAAFDCAEALRELLAPYRFLEVNPAAAETARLQRTAGKLARQLVRAIAAQNLGHNRLGQCVRNLFECLGKGAEGARLSLTAGEDPDSVQRPRARKLPDLDAQGQVPAAGAGAHGSRAHSPRLRLAPVDETGRPRFTPARARQKRPRKGQLGRALDAAGRPAAAPGAAADLSPPEELGAPQAEELGPPLDEREFAQPAETVATADSAEALGPPLEDDGSFDEPLNGPGRRTGGIIHDEEEGDDWTFE